MLSLAKPHRIFFLLAGIFWGISFIILALPAIEGVALQLRMPGNNQVEFPERGSVAPDFELNTLNGETMSLSAYRGHPVLLNFWATWCGPCVLEMPLIENRYQEHSPELVVLGVNASESTPVVDAFVEELNLSFEILLDTRGRVHEQFRVYAFPTTFVIDKDGKVVAQHVGILSEGKLDEYLTMAGVGTYD